MSVILNIDMPENCNKCPLNEGVHCCITGNDWNWGMSERRSDCPMKSVDGLIEIINKQITDNPDAFLSQYRAGLYEVIEIIKEYCGKEHNNENNKM